MMGGLRSRMRASPGGFTIVEVLVVVAVTGALFVSVVLLVGGRQQKAQFEQAVSNLKAQMETVINEAQSGYPGTVTGCRNAGSTYTTTSPDSSCIFLGKAVQFTTNASERNNFGIHTIVGTRDSTSVANAQPYTFAFESRPLWYDLRVVNNTNTQASMLAFTLDYSQATNGSSRGTQGVNVWRVSGASLTNTFTTWRNRSLTSSLTANPVGGTRICFAHGGSGDRSVILTIGAGQTSRVETEVRTNGTCA